MAGRRAGHPRLQSFARTRQSAAGDGRVEPGHDEIGSTSPPPAMTRLGGSAEDRSSQPSSASTGRKYSANSFGFSANGKWPMPAIAWNFAPGIFAAVAAEASTVQE